jgi:hypothetical protein
MLTLTLKNKFLFNISPLNPESTAVISKVGGGWWWGEGMSLKELNSKTEMNVNSKSAKDRLFWLDL